MPLDSTFNEYDFLQGITDSPTLTITPANNGAAGIWYWTTCSRLVIDNQPLRALRQEHNL